MQNRNFEQFGQKSEAFQNQNAMSFPGSAADFRGCVVGLEIISSCS
jgi:hypothetical protein